MAELKKCPFCGEGQIAYIPITLERNDGGFIKCYTCGTRGPKASAIKHDLDDLRKVAISLWNVRDKQVQP